MYSIIKITLPGILLSFLLTTVTSPNSFALDRCTYLISSSHSSFFSYQAAQEIGRASGESICALESNGSLENLYNILNKDNVIAGIVQSDIIKKAVSKQPKKMKDITLAIPLNTEYVHMIVRSDSKINTFQDVGNKVVCIGKNGSGSLYTALQVKAITHTPWVDAKEAFPKCLELLERNSVDVVFTISSPPIKLLSGRIGNEYKLLNIPKIPGYKSKFLSGYSTKKIEVPPVSTVSIDTMLLIKENAIKQNIRIGNKITMGIASVIESLEMAKKDSICAREINTQGLNISYLHKKACSLGYYGKDW